MDVPLTPSTISTGPNYQLFSYGFHTKGSYRHRSSHCVIQSITYNTKTGELLIVDSRGVISWIKNFVTDSVKRIFTFSSYEFNAIRMLVYCSRFNVYFALSKGYRLQVFNLNFNEIFSLDCDSASAHYICVHEERGELVAVAQNCIRIWSYGEILNKAMPLLSTYGLHLRLEIETPDNILISKVEIDLSMDRMYCLVENQVWCYDMDGRFVFKAESTGTAHFTSCVFAPVSHFLVAGGIDGKVYVFTIGGGDVHIFHLYSKMVTGLLIHPSDNQLIITSSLDGVVKLISLNAMEEVYQFPVISEGIHCISRKSFSQIYCASFKSIEIFDLNYFCGIWAHLPYKARSVAVAKSGSKSTKVVVTGEDYNVKIYSKQTRKLLTTVLPPPSVDPLHDVLSCAYDTAGNLIYLLNDKSTIWVYSTRTDPATRVVVWHTRNLCTLTTCCAVDDKAFDLVSTNDHKSDEDNTDCNCIVVLDFNGILEQGILGRPLTNEIRPLVCGMENGNLLLVDSHKEGSRNRKLKIANGAILQLKVDFAAGLLVSLSLGKQCYCLNVIDASNFKAKFSLNLHHDLSCLAYKKHALGCGFSTGEVSIFDTSYAVNQAQKGTTKDHKGDVISIDFDKTTKLLCTAGSDGYLKLWDRDKILLCDFHLGKTLTSACFINSKRDIVLGYKSHVYFIDSNLLTGHGIIEEASDDTADSDKDSIVYESPYLRIDRKHRNTDEIITMENYLVPYDYLNLGSSFLKDACAAVINDSLEENPVSRKVSMASTGQLSFASTRIYQSSEDPLTDDDSVQRFPCYGESPTRGLMPESDSTSSAEDVQDSGDICSSEELPPAEIPQDPKKGNKKKSHQKEDKPLSFSKSFSKKLKTTKIDSRRLQRMEKKKRKPAARRKLSASSQVTAVSATKEPEVQKKRKSRYKKHVRANGASGQDRKAIECSEVISLTTLELVNGPVQISSSDLAGKQSDPDPNDEKTPETDLLSNFGQDVWSNSPHLIKFSEHDTLPSDVSDYSTDDQFNSPYKLEDDSDFDAVNDYYRNIAQTDDSRGAKETVEDKFTTMQPNMTEASPQEENYQELDISSSHESEISLRSFPESSTDSEDSEQEENKIGEKTVAITIPGSFKTKKVRFKPTVSHLSESKAAKEKVVALSKLQYYTSGTNAPLSIFSLARKRNSKSSDGLKNDLRHIYQPEKIEKENTPSQASGKISHVTAVRHQKQYDKVKVSTKSIEPNMKTFTSLSQENIINTDTKPDTRTGERELLEFCINTFKKSKCMSEQVKNGKKREILSSTQSKNKNCSNVDVIKTQISRKDRHSNIYSQWQGKRHQKEQGESLSVVEDHISFEYNEKDIATPAVTIRRPCTPVSQVSDSCNDNNDNDKLFINYQPYLPKFEQQSTSNFKDCHDNDKPTGSTKILSRCFSLPKQRRPIVSEVQEGIPKEKTPCDRRSSNLGETLNRIKSAGLRNELIRRKTLASHSSSRHASALERRGENAVQRRRCISASPSLFRHELITDHYNESAEQQDIYEYTKPTPLNSAGQPRTRSPLFSNKNLEAKLAGQPYRYGNHFNLNEDREKTLVAFAKMLASKSPKPVVLPRTQTAVSIPAKFREFVLVKEVERKNTSKITRMEHELLKQRFQGVYGRETSCP